MENEVQDPQKSAASQSWRDYLSSPKFRQTIVTVFWVFLTSTERAVVLPTLWLYLKTKWSIAAADNFYAASMTIFNVSVLLVTPLCGYLGNRGYRVKNILLVSNQFEVAGNILYLLAPKPELVFIGRLISGFGAGCESILFTETSILTTPEERTKYFILTLISRHFGLLFGPVFTLVLSKVLITYNSDSLTVYNGPGFLMAILWIMHTILTLFVYPNVDEFGKEIKLQLPCLTKPKEVRKYLKDLIKNSKEEKQSVENVTSFRSIWQIYSSYKISTLLMFCSFICYCTMALETNLSPVMTEHFDWDEIGVTYIYLAASILIIIVCMVMYMLTKIWSDYSLLAFGSVLLSIDFLSMSIYLSVLDAMPRITGISLIFLGISIHVIGVPFVVACSESMFSKAISGSEMHRGQIIMRTAQNVAYILGPTVGGALWHKSAIVFSSMFVAITIPTLFLLLKRSSFIGREESTESDSSIKSSTFSTDTNTESE